MRTQAISRLRTVDICRPDLLAAIVPATPEESTCVVETGSPYISAAAIVEIDAIQERRGDEALKTQLAEALVSADQARTRIAELEQELAATETDKVAR